MSFVQYSQAFEICRNQILPGCHKCKKNLHITWQNTKQLKMIVFRSRSELAPSIPKSHFP